MPNESIKRLPIVVIACQVFETILEKLLPPEMAGQITFLDYGLHIVPKNLTGEVQKAIDGIESPSLIILGYGLCGNGLKGVRAGQHTLLIPKTDDCIAILLGSYAEYKDVFSAEPGTYYLTKGWLEAGSNPLAEYRGYVEKYGQTKADLVMDMQYQHYTRLMFVAHDTADFETYREEVQAIAAYCARWGMRYEEYLGSDRLIRQLIDLTLAIHTSGLNVLDENIAKEFVVISSGGEVEQKMFMHL